MNQHANRIRRALWLCVLALATSLTAWGAPQPLTSSAPAAGRTAGTATSANRQGAGFASTNKAARPPRTFNSAQEEELPIESSADRLNYDKENGIVEGVGHVVIKRGETVLKADYVRVDVNSGDAQAFGDVTLMRGLDEWTGPSLKYNFKTGAGVTSDMKISAEPFYLESGESERSADGTFVLHDAWASTCNPNEGPVDFHVTASKMEVKPGVHIKAKNAVWWFGPVPCMWVPYWFKDLDDEYGFTFTPGYSSENGAFLLSSYRYRVNAGVTARTHLDYRAERGVGVGQDFKWNTGMDKHVGDVKGYYADDDKPMDENDIADGKDIDKDRYRLRYHDQYAFTDRDVVMARGHYLSDTDILEDFFEDEFRDERQPDNYVDYTHRGDFYAAGVIVRSRLNDFYENVNRLPEAFLDMYRQPIGDSPFYYEGENSAGFLQRQFAEGSNNEDYDVFRADTKHTIFYPDKYFGFLNIVPRAGVRGTSYSDTRTTETVIDSVVTSNGVLITTNIIDVAAGADMRGLVELGSEFSYKAFRIYDTSLGPRRHIVEPFANYTLIPEPNVTPDQLYQFDEIDQLDEQHNVRFGVRQKWQEKRETGAFDLVDLEISSLFNIHKEEEQDSIEYIFFDGEIRPTDGWAIDFDGQYFIPDSTLQTFNTWLTYLGSRTVETRVEYRWLDEDSNMLYGDVTLFPLSRWSVNGYGRYEFETSQLEEVGGYLQHIFTCIGARVGTNFIPAYERSNGTEEDDEYRFMLEFWLTDFPDGRVGRGRHGG